MPNQDDGLAQILVKDRANGDSYIDMQARHGIPAIECKAIVDEYLHSAASEDQTEQRGLQIYRLERLIQMMWTEVEKNGSFKHAEVIVKIIEKISELLDLYKETVKHQITIISDEETMQLLAVLKQNNALLKQRAIEAGIPSEALEEWAEWASFAATSAVAEIEMSEGEDGTWLPTK